MSDAAASLHDAHVGAWRDWRYRQAQDFLQRLDPEAEEFTFQTFDDVEGRKLKDSARIIHGSFDRVAAKLDALQARGSGVFVTINETDFKGREARNIVRARALFVDLDGAALSAVLEAGLEPHIVVESSPGRWHCYWLVDDCSLDQFNPLQIALANRFNGDPKVKDLPRVMRLPGFRHLKGEAQTCKLVDGIGTTSPPYPVAEVVQRLRLDLSAAGGQQAQQGRAKTGDKIPEGGRNAYVFALGRSLAAKGLTPEAVRAALVAENVARCAPPLPDPEIEELARRAFDANHDPKWQPSGPEKRPTVELRGGALPAVVAACVRALAREGGFFNRGGCLVRVIETREARALGLDTEQNKVRRDERQPVIVSVTPDFLRVRLGELLRFERWNARKRDMIEVDCPRDLPLGVLSLGEWDAIPPLRAIARAPFLRADGTICDTHGYDEASAALLFPSGPVLPVPESPSRGDARIALDALREPFDEIPFLRGPHEAAFVAFLATLAVRPILPTSPGFIFSAPIAGSGKSLLIDCAGLLVHGITPAKRSYPADRDEMRKVLQSVLLAGDSLLAFDNLQAGSSVGGDSLNAYLTADAVGDRTLGQSVAKRTVNSAVFAFTGNNIGAHNDFVRRAIAVTIDPDCEQPESRRFKIPNLRSYVLEHRPRLLCALLTMLRAFVVAGAPPPKRPALGSFEEWDRVVSGMCLWLELPDPVQTQSEIRADDDTLSADSALFKALGDHFGEKPFKVAQVRELCTEGSVLNGAVTAACGINRLPYWFRAHAGQIRNGHKLTRVTGPNTGHATWMIKSKVFERDKAA